jgi:gas vesicle protein GvpN
VTTVLQARPRQFVSTPSVERIAARALRYLQSGYSVHLRGPAGTGKTTLGLHLADLLGRPIMLLFGDDEYKTSDLIGNQLGYTRKKVVDNFIHSVVKVEDEVRQNWVDSRLTLACREGFTLVYDEFNRSRPEVNNVLLSALEEKLLVLPPSGNRPEYVRVSPHFRGIFTSNPEEYCGVHGTQDALLDRLITINMPEPDELTQQEILVQKTNIDRAAALAIVRLVKSFQRQTSKDKISSLRSSLMIGKICQEHHIPVLSEDVDFRDTCSDILLSRAGVPLGESRQILWNLFNSMVIHDVLQVDADLEADIPTMPDLAPHALLFQTAAAPVPLEVSEDVGLSQAEPSPEAAIAPDAEAATLEALEDWIDAEASETDIWSEPERVEVLEQDIEPDDELDVTDASELIDADADEWDGEQADVALEVDLAIAADPATDLKTPSPALVALAVVEADTEPHVQAVYEHLDQAGPARLADLEATLGLNRFQTVNALRYLCDQGLIAQHGGNGKPSVYHVRLNA